MMGRRERQPSLGLQAREWPRAVVCLDWRQRDLEHWCAWLSAHVPVYFEPCLQRAYWSASVVRVFVRRPEICRAKLFTKHPLSSAKLQPHHETPPASRKHRCRLCLFISTLLASPSKHPKIAQSSAAVGLAQRAPSLLNTSACQSKWFANLASRRPGQRGRFERSQPINHVTYSWTPAHGSRRVGQAAAANVWSNSLRAGVSCAWQKEPLYIGIREIVNEVL